MRSRQKFKGLSIVELLAAIVIVGVLVSLVIQIGFHSRPGCRAGRVQGEIAVLASACESYRADMGRYPMDAFAEEASPGVTEQLSPKEHLVPTSTLYQRANLFLYRELTGDKRGSCPDGQPGEPRYLRDFDIKMLKATKDPSNRIIEVKYIQDPWGFPYGYSTAAAREVLLHARRINEAGNPADTVSAETLPGFNGSSFDLWSTGGSRPTSTPQDKPAKEREWAKWVKNW